jgi:CubicO group peptidase (beta-lactamase class C family)
MTQRLAMLCLLLCVTASFAKTEIDKAHLRHIADRVKEAHTAGEFAGCVVAIGTSEGLVYLEAFGDRQVIPERVAMTTDTVFDMASVTKPVTTATSIMVLFERGALRLTDPINKHLPEITGEHGSKITITDLLTHRSGYIPDNPIGDYQHGIDESWKRLFALKPTDEVGMKFKYSDVNFELLGKIVERTSGEPLDVFAKKNIFAPLGMKETGYKPAPELAARAAATEPRNGVISGEPPLVGEVHDPRAALLGGVAGHAGLFSTAEDLARYAEAMLKGGAPVLHDKTLQLMTEPLAKGDPSYGRSRGWDKRSGFSSNRGDLMTDQAYGHGGFTGNAFWIDPGLDIYVIFLSNRLHPDGVGNVNDLAGRIGTIAAAAAAAGR